MTRTNFSYGPLNHLGRARQILRLLLIELLLGCQSSRDILAALEVWLGYREALFPAVGALHPAS